MIAWGTPLLFCNVVVIVPVSVVGSAHVIIIGRVVLIAYVWRPGIVDADILGSVNRKVTGDDHHVASSSGPMPGEGKWLLTAVDLILQLIPSQRCVGRSFESEPVLVELGPATVNASVGCGRVTAICMTEAFVRFVALRDVDAQELHHHLATGRPTPH